MIAPPSLRILRGRLLQLLLGVLLVLVALSFMPAASAESTARGALTAEQTRAPRETPTHPGESVRPGAPLPERCPADTLCLPSR
ncbi:hypothetical protein OWM54_24295 [Myxococcus sp. MISCRS1]|uniref:hypothetical protein n=1 Tax=Myxococcus TaxID=32 RepID=UPI001CBE1147|nr:MULTISPECIES: hypothetical protein [unclassified Myxococcus]MBZ4398589.1 hypothetical protein [Myxococcus sp. AS-1-15]MBZ4414467.1 hypothetical protein [Myxococcus sp. XM-1-1-1]MCY1000265.1 hypothetical protein [Myxococcus sp. MISCRS1]BDT38197.1 hypothetical protein MFMH1_78660 [Myxococcus sp. MH1]